ncbi:MAG: dihydrodipicolinate reductase [Mycolicibacterium sp.]|nr:dihydrodipicolinate reductase [Mycolicibacterium sp.]
MLGATAPTSRHRVVQWSTGTIGVRGIRGIVDHPDLELAGVYVHGSDKAGRDAGDLCGLAPTGVLATDDVEAIVGIAADCVLYMPNAPDVEQICRLLAAGTNVVTTCGLFHHPASMDPATRARVTAACEAGGTSIHGTGSSPGFISEAVPLVLTSIQRRLDHLYIDEYADLSQRNSPELLFDLMGFGKPIGPFEDFRASYLESSFGPSLRLVADAVGLPLDRLESSGELAAATRDVTIAAGTIAAGSVAGQRITVEGIRDGRVLLQFRATWYCSTDLAADWNLEDTGWHISVGGDAPLEVGLHMPIPLDQMAAISPAYTANRAVNAVPWVCAATPGIVTTVDLPHVLPHVT